MKSWSSYKVDLHTEHPTLNKNGIFSVVHLFSSFPEDQVLYACFRWIDSFQREGE